MRVKSMVTGSGMFGHIKLTEGRLYQVLQEHDTVYELVADDGHTYCYPKGFFTLETPFTILHAAYKEGSADFKAGVVAALTQASVDVPEGNSWLVGILNRLESN